MGGFDYFRSDNSEQFRFYRVPKILFTDKRFKSISPSAKLLYGLMLDRVSLSRKNGWIDELGRVYIIFTIQEMKELMSFSNNALYRALKELDAEEGIGLIERKRQGFTKPNVIYVKNFSSMSEKKGNYPLQDDVLNRKNQGFSERENMYFQNEKSRFLKMENQEFSKRETNDTDTSDTDDLTDQSERYTFGMFRNVLFTKEEFQMLKERFPSDWQSRIEELSEYMASNGKKYQNHFATICNWARREQKSGKRKERSYDCPKGDYL